MKSLAVLAASCVLAGVPAAGSSDWPSLRGPRHDGAVPAVFDASEGAGFSVAWRAALGAGYSSVAVAEGRAVTLFSDGRNDVAVAFDARTGKELWRHPIAPTLPGRDGSFDGPISTPALSAGRVFGLGPRGHLFGLDASTGRELWTVDLVTREGAKLPFYGFGTSPIVAGGVLVVPLGAPSGGAIAGFDLATGERRWRLGEDGVAYQSPILLSVGGREQVVAVGDTRVFGIDPAAGRLLWEHVHGGEVHPIATESIVPVPAGDGRLFLKLRQDGSAMLRLVPRPDGGATVETLWTAPVLRTTYVVPVYHGGFLYGMSGRSTLTCVDAGTGEVRWRSREPGDGFPLVVGDDLVILTKEKSLHVGPASPEGWKERARLDLFHDLVWSSPGFAEGAVFARSQGELVRVDWRRPEAAPGAAAPPATATRVPVSGRLSSFLAELDAAADKSATVDRFLASLPAGPLVEWPDRVAFLYRGQANDVGIAGDMIGDRREDPMARIGGTDLFWYETTLSPDARISYHFVRDFEERFPDPRNPWRVPAPATGTIGAFPAEQSSLAMPAWRPPDHLAEAAPERRGRIEEHVVDGASRPGSRVAVRVYVPAGAEKGRQPLPLALVLDGDDAREKGLLTRSLDNVIPSRVAPVLVAFVSRPEWGEKPPSDDEAEDAAANLLAHDVVPFLERRYRTHPHPETRALVGTGFAAWRAAYAAFRHPTIFGALGLQSVVMLDTDQDLLEKQVRTAAQVPLRLYLDWGRYDRRGTREGWDMRRANQRFDAFLRERGYRPAGGEVPEGAGWAGWRNRNDRVFEALFPALPAAGPAAAEP
jgi:enterochelin esterase-like enzyme/outer membrane protein assembly factor BamB